LAWDAEHNPRNVGFSHNVLARLARDGEQTVVEAITHVQSVDLVADPAATQGLFEEEQSAATAAGVTAAWDSLSLAELRGRRPDLIAEFVAEETTRLAAELSEATERAVQAEGRLEAHLAEQGQARRLAADAAGRPRSSEQAAALAPRDRTAATARDFARAIQN
jgi:hypothetical protein